MARPRAGSAPNDVVAVLMKNSAAFLDIAFATSHIGAIFLPINYRLAPDEVDYIVENSGARLCSPTRNWQRERRRACTVVLVDDAAQARRHAACVERQAGDARIAGFRTDLMRLMYTSGTTDRPKGVMHSYENFYWKSADQVLVLGLGARRPAAGRRPALPCRRARPAGHRGAVGRRNAVASSAISTPRSALAAIAAERLTGGVAGAGHDQRVLACPERERYDVSQPAMGDRRRREDAGGAHPRLLAIFHQCALHRRLRPDRNRAAATPSWSRAARSRRSARPAARWPMSRSKSATTAGDALPAGRERRNLPARPEGHARLLEGPREDRGRFFGDWFRTGDVGYLDDDGFLYLTDRKKDMIISGGENIASSEVERVIYELPQVREVAVDRHARSSAGASARSRSSCCATARRWN